MKKRISKKVAREQYGIITGRPSVTGLSYFLLDNGNVVDSDGDLRYQKPE